MAQERGGSGTAGTRVGGAGRPGRRDGPVSSRWGDLREWLPHEVPKLLELDRKAGLVLLQRNLIAERPADAQLLEEQAGRKIRRAAQFGVAGEELFQQTGLTETIASLDLRLYQFVQESAVVRRPGGGRKRAGQPPPPRLPAASSQDG